MATGASQRAAWFVLLALVSITSPGPVAAQIVEGQIVEGQIVEGQIVEGQSVENQSDENQAGVELLALAELLPDPDRIHPDIAAQVEVDLSQVGPVALRLSVARADLNDANSRIVRSIARLGSLEIDRGLLESDLIGWQSEAGTAAALLDASELDLSEFAVDTFLGFEGIDLGALRLEGTVDPAESLSDDVAVLLTDARNGLADRHDKAVDEVAGLEANLTALDAEVLEIEVAMAAALSEAATARARVDQEEPAFEVALLGARVRGADFPVVVLDAYYRAQLVLVEERPSCEVRWDQLAGIGRVESVHGSYGAAVVGIDGRTSTEILGPVLDGDPWLAIADTDGGLYDGDITWDRAVGPMQFIPGSWSIYGRDADGDGVADPHNMYDAALAAAHHLCGTSGGLSDPGRFTQALFGYNRSASYGQSVQRYTESYREQVSLESGPDSAAA